MRSKIRTTRRSSKLATKKKKTRKEGLFKKKKLTKKKTVQEFTQNPKEILDYSQFNKNPKKVIKTENVGLAFVPVWCLSVHSNLAQ